MTARSGPHAYAHLVLRITDARTGEPVEAAPVRRGLTRVEAHPGGPGLTALRVLLVADLLVRALELGGTPVWALLAAGPEEARLRAAAAALGVRPFEDGREVAAGLGEAQVIRVAEAGPGGPPGADGRTVHLAVAAARTAPGLTVPGLGDAGPAALDDSGPDGPVPGRSGLGAPGHPGSARGGPGQPGSGNGGPAHGGPSADAAGDDGRGPVGPVDPAVLRLALLGRPRDTPVHLDAPALAQARETLLRWRRAVTGWAREPSRPVPADVRQRLREAWEDDLDAPAVLRVLRQTEEAGPGLPAGARFETYAYADRLLGLDLVRDLGAPA